MFTLMTLHSKDNDTFLYNDKDKTASLKNDKKVKYHKLDQINLLLSQVHRTPDKKQDVLQIQHCRSSSDSNSNTSFPSWHKPCVRVFYQL